MTGDAPQTSYRSEEVRDALVRDPEIGQLDVQIAISGSQAVVTGTTPTSERRDVITARVEELLPEVQVINRMQVIDQHGSHDEERLP